MATMATENPDPPEDFSLKKVYVLTVDAEWRNGPFTVGAYENHERALARRNFMADASRYTNCGCHRPDWEIQRACETCMSLLCLKCARSHKHTTHVFYEIEEYIISMVNYHRDDTAE